MFIQTEETPNPHAMKFIPDQPVLADGVRAVEIASAERAALSPLAESLFAVSGVAGVWLASGFLTVQKTEQASWTAMRPLLLAALMDHYVAGRPVLAEGAEAALQQYSLQDEDETVRQINAIIEERLRPALAQDGGDVQFVSYEDGIVHVRLKGACAGCPSATVTLKNGIERLLKAYLPQIQSVEQVL